MTFKVLLFAQNCIDEDVSGLDEAIAAYGTNNKQALEGRELVVHLVGQWLQLGLFILTQRAPLRLSPISMHAIKHVLEPVVVNGQYLQVVELVFRHPIKLLLALC
jgi:hypothetical protein